MYHQFINVGGDDLFSVYHDPLVINHDNTGVVLCYPLGQEYIRCHRLYVNMANKLAKAGFSAFRFDYYGTGDSSGDFSSLTIEKSLNNIKCVVEQFREFCGLSHIVLFGVRLGATLALLYSQTHSIDGLVLWNPILEGSAYLSKIEANYRKWLNGSFAKEKRKSHSGIENFGFQYSRELINEIRQISIGNEVLINGVPKLVFGDEEWDVSGHDDRIVFEKPVNKEYWIKREDEFDKAVVPPYETGKSIEWLHNLKFK